MARFTTLSTESVRTLISVNGYRFCMQSVHLRRVLSRARYAALGAAVGAALGGLISKSAASSGGAIGGLVGATFGETQVTAQSRLEGIKERGRARVEQIK